MFFNSKLQTSMNKESYPEQWYWTPRAKEVVTLRDNKTYRYHSGCPGQLGRRYVTKSGKDVDEDVEYYKGLGWLSKAEKAAIDAKKKT